MWNYTKIFWHRCLKLLICHNVNSQKWMEGDFNNNNNNNNNKKLVTEENPCLENLLSIVYLCLSTQLYEAVLLYDYCMEMSLLNSSSSHFLYWSAQFHSFLCRQITDIRITDLFFFLSFFLSLALLLAMFTKNVKLFHFQIRFDRELIFFTFCLIWRGMCVDRYQMGVS